VVGCWHGYLSAQLMSLPLTVSCFSEIQIGFTFLVPAHPGSPGQRAVKRVCVLLVSLIRQRSSKCSNCVHFQPSSQHETVTTTTTKEISSAAGGGGVGGGPAESSQQVTVVKTIIKTVTSTPSSPPVSAATNFSLLYPVHTARPDATKLSFRVGRYELSRRQSAVV